LKTKKQQTTFGFLEKGAKRPPAIRFYGASLII